MEIKNCGKLNLDAEISIKGNISNADINWDTHWFRIIDKKRIILIPTQRIRSLIIERKKGTIIKQFGGFENGYWVNIEFMVFGNIYTNGYRN